MSLDSADLAWPKRVVAIGRTGELVRGRTAEFRHAGLVLRPHDRVIDALIDLAKQPASVILIDTAHLDISADDAIHLLRSQTEAPILLGIGDSAETAATAALLRSCDVHAVLLPVTPQRLGDAIRRLPVRVEVQAPIQLGDLVVDEAGFYASWQGRRIDLTRRSFELLALLAHAYPRYTSPADIAQTLAMGHTSREVNVRSIIARLRAGLARSIPDDIDLLVSVPRVGVRLEVGDLATDAAPSPRSERALAGRSRP